MNATSDHTRLDERSLALHRLVAGKLVSRPELIELAHDNLRRWQESGRVPALVEWEGILSRPLSDVIAVLTDSSDNASRLRQSSPFAGILTEAERRSVYESFAARTHHSRGERDRG